MGINIEALKIKVAKAINKLPHTVDILRPTLNDLEEPDGEELVVRLTGQYYKARNSYLATKMADGGETKTNQVERFMTIINDDSQLVREGDFFELNDITFRIIDRGNTLGVYFDMTLERTTERM